MTTRLWSALLAGSVLFAACGGDAPEATPSATASIVVDEATAPASPADRASPSPTAPTNGPRSENPTAAPTSDPGPSPTSQPNPNPQGVDPEPIPTGTYSYSTDGWTQLGAGAQQPLPPTTTLLASAPSGNVQDVFRDLRDSDGYGQRIMRRMEYTSDGFLLHEIHTTGKVSIGLLGDAAINTRLVANPPGALGSPDSDVGWTNTFTMAGDGTTATVTAKLVRFEDVSIGGKTVRAAVVTQHVEFSGDIEGTSDATTWLRPEDLLPLREESVTEATSTGVSQRSEYSATLKSLTPA